jgi:hypothetical protein
MYGYHIPAAVFISVPLNLLCMKLYIISSETVLAFTQPMPSGLIKARARVEREAVLKGKAKYAKPSTRVAGLEPSSINPRHW